MKSSVHRIQFVWLEGGARGHQYEGVSVIPEISPPPPREGGLGWAPTLLGGRTCPPHGFRSREGGESRELFLGCVHRLAISVD